MFKKVKNKATGVFGKSSKGNESPKKESPKIAMAQDPYTITLVIVGDAYKQEKTKLCLGIRDGDFEPDYVPTVVDNYEKRLVTNSITINLSFWDTAGQEVYLDTRKASYKNKNAILLVYNVGNQQTFDNITDIWMEDVKQDCDKNSIILVGIDDGQTKRTISLDQARQLAKELKINPKHVHEVSFNDIRTLNPLFMSIINIPNNIKLSESQKSEIVALLEKQEVDSELDQNSDDSDHSEQRPFNH